MEIVSPPIGHLLMGDGQLILVLVIVIRTFDFAG